MDSFTKPTIEYGQLAPLLIVFGIACLGVLVEAFVPRRSRFLVQSTLAIGGIVLTLASVIVVGTRLTEHGGVARAPRGLDHGHLVTRHLVDRVEHLPHRVPRAAAQVDDVVLAGHPDGQRPYVRVGEVDDVDVVADAGAVLGRVVGAEQRERLAGTGRRPQGVGDEVGLGGVPLAV